MSWLWAIPFFLSILLVTRTPGITWGARVAFVLLALTTLAVALFVTSEALPSYRSLMSLTLPIAAVGVWFMIVWIAPREILTLEFWVIQGIVTVALLFEASEIERGSVLGKVLEGVAVVALLALFAFATRILLRGRTAFQERVRFRARIFTSLVLGAALITALAISTTVLGLVPSAMAQHLLPGVGAALVGTTACIVAFEPVLLLSSQTRALLRREGGLEVQEVSAVLNSIFDLILARRRSAGGNDSLEPERREILPGLVVSTEPPASAPNEREQEGMEFSRSLLHRDNLWLSRTLLELPAPRGIPVSLFEGCAIAGYREFLESARERTLRRTGVPLIVISPELEVLYVRAREHAAAHQVFIIAGPEGVGKHSLSRAINSTRYVRDVLEFDARCASERAGLDHSLEELALGEGGGLVSSQRAVIIRNAELLTDDSLERISRVVARSAPELVLHLHLADAFEGGAAAQLLKAYFEGVGIVPWLASISPLRCRPLDMFCQLLSELDRAASSRGIALSRIESPAIAEALLHEWPRNSAEVIERAGEAIDRAKEGIIWSFNLTHEVRT